MTDLVCAKRLLLRTHIAALKNGERANSYYLESGPGIGKSDSQFQYAQDLAQTIGQPVGLVPFMLATVASVDVRGYMMPKDNAETGGVDSVFSTPPWYPTRNNMYVVEPGGKWHSRHQWKGVIPEVGVVFLDEFGQAEEDVRKPAAELLCHGNVGDSELPIGWRVTAAGNRTEDRSGALRELMFIINRRCLLSVDPSLEAWKKWVISLPEAKRPHYLTCMFAEKEESVVFLNSVPEGEKPYCTPRSLCRLDQDLRAIRSEQDEERDVLPVDEDARVLASGWIGQGAATQFFSHIKYASEIPTLAEIVKNPNKTKVPAKRDAQFVCSFMLQAGINADNRDNVLTYANRLNIDMQAQTYRGIAMDGEKMGDVVTSPIFLEWTEKHQDLIDAAGL